MKKIFYILTAAIVALGAMACENEGFDNIGPEANGEGLTITATVSRVAWDENTYTPTKWEQGDKITIDGFEFTTTDGVNFVCKNDKVYSLCDGLVHTATTTLNSEIGLKGAELTAQGVIKKEGTSLTFKTASALLMFTTKGTFKDAFVLTGEGLFSDGKTIVNTWQTTEVKTFYVPVKAGVTTLLNYSIGGVTQKEKSITTVAGTIYDLGTLTAEALTGWGIVGAHQGWKAENAEALYKVPGSTNTYARGNVKLASSTDGSGFKFYNKGVNLNLDRYVFFKPNSNWTQSSAWFAAYSWDGKGNTWAKMVKGTDLCANYYYVEADKIKSDGVIFVRMNNTKTALDWDSKWNQTSNQKKQTNGNNLFTLNSSGWDDLGGAWSKLSPSIVDLWVGKTTSAVTNSFNTWATAYTNNGPHNITVSDYNKTYDIYFSPSTTHEFWGFPVYINLIQHGSNVKPTLK